MDMWSKVGQLFPSIILIYNVITEGHFFKKRSENIHDRAARVKTCGKWHMMIVLDNWKTEKCRPSGMAVTRRAVSSPCCLVTSVVSDSAAPWPVARQAPLSLGILQARILEWVVKLYLSILYHPRLVFFFLHLNSAFSCVELIHW